MSESDGLRFCWCSVLNSFAASQSVGRNPQLSSNEEHLNFENLVAKVLPITISSAAMVKEKGRLIGIGIFELDEHFSTLDNPAALCALLYFRHCFLTYRGLEQAFAMLMGDTQASRDRRILVLR